MFWLTAVTSLLVAREFDLCLETLMALRMAFLEAAQQQQVQEQPFREPRENDEVVEKSEQATTVGAAPSFNVILHKAQQLLELLTGGSRFAIEPL